MGQGVGYTAQILLNGTGSTMAQGVWYTAQILLNDTGSTMGQGVWYTAQILLNDRFYHGPGRMIYSTDLIKWQVLPWPRAYDIQHRSY